MLLETMTTETHYRRSGGALYSVAKISSGIDSSSYSSSSRERERKSALLAKTRANNICHSLRKCALLTADGPAGAAL